MGCVAVPSQVMESLQIAFRASESESFRLRRTVWIRVELEDYDRQLTERRFIYSPRVIVDCVAFVGSAAQSNGKVSASEQDGLNK
jgi:hypothetical protein